MKTAMKKVLSMALVLVLLLSVFPMNAFAAGFPNHGWHNQNSDETAAIDTGADNIADMTAGEDDQENTGIDTAAAGDGIAGMLPGQGDQNFEIWDPESDQPSGFPGFGGNGFPSVDNTCKDCKQDPCICCPNCRGTLVQHENRCPDKLCDDCQLDANSCICCDSCNGTIYEHDRFCRKQEQEHHFGEIKVTPKFRNERGQFVSADPVYVSMRATMGDVFAMIPVPANYSFSYWSWDEAGQKKINNHDAVPAHGDLVIFAQYAKQVQAVEGYTVYVNLNYERKMGDTLKNVARGARMGDVLQNIQNPVRMGYDFAGWFWDAEGRYEVKWNDTVNNSCAIFAKWNKKNVHHETMLKIYVNGDVHSAAKIVDMYAYTKDGMITINEVKEVVSKYYTAKDSNGLAYYGLFDSNGWNIFSYNWKHPGANHINVSFDHDTIIYVMVNNAKVITSATADKTNPKTGDMIMMPAAVLGLSASALAVLFYLNKKRAI